MRRNIKNLKSEWGATFIFGFLIVALYFSLRLINLTILPVFADEAIYLRWSQVMRTEPSLRFLPLSDGKQPLFMWLTIPFFKIFSDPLLAGRFLSVLSGFGSLVGIFLLSLVLFGDKKISLISSLFYAVTPFFVFFNRMALVDSMLTMLGIWVVFLGVLLVHFLRLDLAMMAGIALGVALITKSPAIFFAILLPSTIILPSPRTGLGQKRTRLFLKILPSSRTGLEAAKLLGLWLVVYVFAFVIYNLLRLGPNFQMIAIRNKDYVFSFQEILSHPLDPLKPHLGDLAKWLPNLLTWPVFLLATGGLARLWAEGKKRREATFLFLLVFVPLSAQSIFAKVFTPRYILFTVWPLIIFASFLLERLSKFVLNQLKTRSVTTALQCVVITGLMILLLLPTLSYDWFLLKNPEKAPLPRKMRSGYLEEWPAGQGIKEIADFVKEKSSKGNVFIGTEGFFGTLPDGLQIYLEGNSRVTIIGVGYPVTNVHPSLVNSLVDNDVYLVVNQSRLQIPPEAYGLKLVGEYPKAVDPEGNQDKLLFFEVDREFWQES